jgi:protein-L-isoaspartate(D-aspartate) O-methyltransferase
VRGAGRSDVDRMVRLHLAGRDITDPRVLDAMASVPREAFVPEHLRAHAYDDAPLPIGHEQTISQPYIVALMIQEAQVGPDAAVLDVGTGSGYQTALLATLARHVWSVERLTELSETAGERLEALGVRNVTLAVADGALGWEPGAPYDAIIVAAAAPRPPQPLLDQLTVHGRLVIPLGDRGIQDLTIIERTPRGLRTTRAGACRFVPLVSREAFPADW